MVSRSAKFLGYAGLLPQVLAVALMLVGRRGHDDLAWLPLLSGYLLAMVYGGLILSFLGGIWWGFAVRRTGTAQVRLAAIAVVPSLVALVAIGWAAGALPGVPSPWPAILLGVGILLTLPVDRALVRSGDAPAGWMGLRTPLSMGLGALTIAAGLLIAR